MAAPQRPPTPQEIVARRTLDEMRELEAPYLRAIEYVRGPQFQLDQKAALGKIRDLVASGIKEQSQSLLILGRIQQILIDNFAHEEVIMKFEGLKRSINEWGGTVRD